MELSLSPIAEPIKFFPQAGGWADVLVALELDLEVLALAGAHGITAKRAAFGEALRVGLPAIQAGIAESNSLRILWTERDDNCSLPPLLVT